MSVQKLAAFVGMTNSRKTGNSGASTIFQVPASSDKAKLPPDSGNFSGSQEGVMVVDEGNSGSQRGSATNEPT